MMVNVTIDSEFALGEEMEKAMQPFWSSAISGASTLVKQEQTALRRALRNFSDPSVKKESKVEHSAKNSPATKRK